MMDIIIAGKQRQPEVVQRNTSYIVLSQLPVLKSSLSIMGMMKTSDIVGDQDGKSSCSLDYEMQAKRDVESSTVEQLTKEQPSMPSSRHAAKPDTAYSQALARVSLYDNEEDDNLDDIGKSNTNMFASASLTSSSTSYAASNCAASTPTDDVLSASSTAASIKRSFDILQKMEHRLNKEHVHRDPPTFFPGMGMGMYRKEWTQEEKDGLVAFANKHILGKRTEREEERKEEEDRFAKKRRGS
jgi:hypothetical protein